MERTLLVLVPQLNAHQRAGISKAAEAAGLTPVFCETYREALPYAETAEVIFSANADLLAHAPRLRWACTPTAGVDAFVKPGVFASLDAVLTNSSGAYGTTIAEHVIMVLLMLMRREMEYRKVVAQREWTRGLAVRSIHGSRITLLGTGDIGRSCAQRLSAFGPKALIGVNRSGQTDDAFDRVANLTELDTVLSQTDVLIMSLPGTAETKGVMSAQRLSRLPANAFLVNVGRGQAIDEAALEAKLRAGRLAGAALDVFEQEPLPRDSTLWNCPRLLITPHTAGNMTLGHTADLIVSTFVQNLERYGAGLPLLHLVDRGKGY